MAETAIIVPLHEAEPAIDLIRRAHTRSGADGMPAHITLLYPFTDSDLLVAGRVREVREIFEAFPQFDVKLVGLRYFDDAQPRTLYLAPNPPEPFLDLTQQLTDKFPEHQPYGGKHATVIPHVTVAVAEDETLAELEAQISETLPIAARATEGWLMQRNAGGVWEIRHRFQLAGESL